MLRIAGAIRNLPAKSGERLGHVSRLGEFGLNDGENTFDIPEHVVVPKAKYLVSLLAQPLITNSICCGFVVLPAVDFNDDSLLAAYEIADLADDRFLPDEFVSIDPPISDAIPENRLGIRLIGTQAPCESDRLFVVATHWLALSVREAPLSHSLAPFLRGEGGVRGCLREFDLDCK
ncbi:hypothetical protein [Bradyrhizobium stylosanthis]|uniref:Uncharacterized protein n=1 Tax=Bradyrhizobium stylosanthis TaxID=1803665 RepID=A0A560D2N1_9BRAD|nr:hypothetical protein FBZ96_11396 [Bradyrhizobium stylosanthis]